MYNALSFASTSCRLEWVILLFYYLVPVEAIFDIIFILLIAAAIFTVSTVITIIFIILAIFLCCLKFARKYGTPKHVFKVHQ
jgi:ABC-type multidrug transport system permease subunit